MTRIVATALCATLCCIPPAWSQAGAVDATAAGAFTYTDHTFGFELELPANWEYDRARYPGIGGSIGLLRGQFGAGQRSLRLEIYRSYRPSTFPAWVDRFTGQIGAVRGTVRIETKTRNEDRGDCIIEASAAAAKRYYICVPFDARTVWVMTVAVLGNQPENLQAAERAVETAYRSLKITFSPAVQKDLTAALQRGQSVLTRLKTGTSPFTIAAEPKYYESIGADGPLGFTEFQMTQEKHKNKAGWRTRARTWEFGRDGAASYVRTSAFCATDFSTGLIETRTDYLSASDARRGVLTTLDQCVREGESLFTTFSRSDDPRNSKSPPPVRTGPSYLPHVLLRQLPAILGREPGPWHAFVIYDTQVRALLFHLIRAAGRDKSAGAGGAESYLYEVRDGFASGSATLKTDRAGNLLEYIAGDTRVVARSKAYIEQTYGPRRDAALARLPK